MKNLQHIYWPTTYPQCHRDHKITQEQQGLRSVKISLTTYKVAWYIILVLSVCLSDDNFQKPWHTKLTFAHRMYLQRTEVKFVYEGHQVKLKVTGAQNVQYAYVHIHQYR